MNLRSTLVIDSKEESVWIEFIDQYSNNYPNIVRLIIIMHIIPMSNAICEKGFSCLNLIKNKLRNCLSNFYYFSV